MTAKDQVHQQLINKRDRLMTLIHDDLRFFAIVATGDTLRGNAFVNSDLSKPLEEIEKAMTEIIETGDYVPPNTPGA